MEVRLNIDDIMNAWIDVGNIENIKYLFPMYDVIVINKVQEVKLVEAGILKDEFKIAKSDFGQGHYKLEDTEIFVGEVLNPKEDDAINVHKTRADSKYYKATIKQSEDTVEMAIKEQGILESDRDIELTPGFKHWVDVERAERKSLKIPMAK